MSNENSNLKVKWAILCQNASVDQQTNTVSLFNVLEELKLSQSPLDLKNIEKKTPKNFPDRTQVNTNYSLVILTERPAGLNKAFESQMRLELVDPDGEVFGHNEFPVKFDSPDKKRTRTIVSFDTIIVRKSGVYSFVISTKSAGDKEFKKQTSADIDVQIYN